MCGVDCVILKKWRHHEIKHHEDLKRKKIDKFDILNIQFKEDPFFFDQFPSIQWKYGNKNYTGSDFTDRQKYLLIKGFMGREIFAEVSVSVLFDPYVVWSWGMNVLASTQLIVAYIIKVISFDLIGIKSLMFRLEYIFKYVRNEHNFD